MAYFNNDAIKRIRKTVKAVESRPNLKLAIDRSGSRGNQEFLAVLTSSYSSGYSWSYIVQNDDGTMTTDANSGSSAEMGKAFHVNGCQTLASGMIVKMYNRRLFELTASECARHGVTSADIASDSSGSSNIGTVWNYYGAPVPSGTRITVNLEKDKWVIRGADCEEA